MTNQIDQHEYNIAMQKKKIEDFFGKYSFPDFISSLRSPSLPFVSAWILFIKIFMEIGTENPVKLATLLLSSDEKDPYNCIY